MTLIWRKLVLFVLMEKLVRRRFAAPNEMYHNERYETV